MLCLIICYIIRFKINVFEHLKYYIYFDFVSIFYMVYSIKSFKKMFFYLRLFTNTCFVLMILLPETVMLMVVNFIMICMSNTYTTNIIYILIT